MEEKLIGYFGVDAGLVMICDPCYIYSHDDGGKLSENFPKTWQEFCQKFLYKNEEILDYCQMDFDSGHPGLGVLSSTGHGDGTYPVYATIDRGTVLELRIVFDEPYKDEDDDYYENYEDDESEGC